MVSKEKLIQLSKSMDFRPAALQNRRENAMRFIRENFGSSIYKFGRKDGDCGRMLVIVYEGEAIDDNLLFLFHFSKTEVNTDDWVLLNKIQKYI